MPYALFEKEYRLSRTFPTASDVWRCAEDCGLVIDDANGRQRLDDGYAIRPCLPDAPEAAEPASDRMMQKKSGVIGTKPPDHCWLVKCGNLERGESMKDPVRIFGSWRGFSFAGRRRPPQDDAGAFAGSSVICQ